MTIFSYSSHDELIESLTIGKLYDKKLLSITTSMVSRNMTIDDAINEQLDIIFDEILLSNSSLCSNKSLLECSLRSIGTSWKRGLQKL